MKKVNRKKRSFTLLEILLVLSLAVVVLGVFSVSGMKFYRHCTLLEKERTLEDVIFYARTAAIVEDKTITLYLTHEDHTLRYKLDCSLIRSKVPKYLKEQELQKIESVYVDDLPCFTLEIVATPWGVHPFGALRIKDTYGQEFIITHEMATTKKGRYPQEVFSPY